MFNPIALEAGQPTTAGFFGIVVCILIIVGIIHFLSQI